jgi:hypothetical protein
MHTTWEIARPKDVAGIHPGELEVDKVDLHIVFGAARAVRLDIAERCFVADETRTPGCVSFGLKRSH